MHCYKVRTSAMSRKAMVPAGAMVSADQLKTSYKCEDHRHAAIKIELEAAATDAKHACSAANCVQAVIQV